MAKRDKKEKKAPSREKSNFLGASGRNMTYKDLKRKAIILGMPFPDACSAGVFDLLGYINNSEEKPDKSLIDKYDDWMDKQLENIGYSKDNPLRSSRLRLGFLGEEGENGQRKIKRVPGIKKPREKKPPRERDEFNLIKGTKKSYVWELTSKGYDIDRVIRRMKKKFPEANEKSINLWYRMAKRTINGKTKGK
jgi:hypothetical protein